MARELQSREELPPGMLVAQAIAAKAIEQKAIELSPAA